MYNRVTVIVEFSIVKNVHMQDSITYVTPTNTLLYNLRLQFLHSSYMFRRCYLATFHHTPYNTHMQRRDRIWIKEG